MKTDQDKIKKIVEEAEKLAAAKTTDKIKSVALSRKIDKILNPPKYFKRIT